MTATRTTDVASVSGTSFAAPIVSGVVAMMLQANPELGYRDVQEILALSSQKIDLGPSGTWAPMAPPTGTAAAISSATTSASD